MCWLQKKKKKKIAEKWALCSFNLPFSKLLSIPSSVVALKSNNPQSQWKPTSLEVMQDGIMDQNSLKPPLPENCHYLTCLMVLWTIQLIGCLYLIWLGVCQCKRLPPPPPPKKFVQNYQRQMFNNAVAWCIRQYGKQEVNQKTQKGKLGNKMYIEGFEKLWYESWYWNSNTHVQGCAHAQEWHEKVLSSPLWLTLRLNTSKK